MDAQNNSTFKKSGGNKGPKFQNNLVTLFFLKSLKKLNDWKLSSENKQVKAFDDVVLELPGEAVLVQAKSKEKREVTYNTLFSTTKKDDFSLPKYFLAFEEIKSKFKVKNVVICTNATVNVSNKLKAMLENHNVTHNDIFYCDGYTCCFYTFNDTILPQLKDSSREYYKNATHKDIEEDMVSDEKILDFLKHLRFYYSYPCEKDMTAIIRQYLLELRRLDSVFRDVSAEDIHNKVEEWWQLPCGDCNYLTETVVRAMFLEIRSDRYCHTLDQYNMLFEKNNFFPDDVGRIFHAVVEGDHFLPLQRIFRMLHQNKVDALYVNPKDSASIQRQTIEAFRVSRYNFLVITGLKIRSKAVLREICSNLRETLQNNENKKIILLAERNSTFSQQLDENSSKNVINISVTFDDFSDDTQTWIQKKKRKTYVKKLFNPGLEAKPVVDECEKTKCIRE